MNNNSRQGSHFTASHRKTSYFDMFFLKMCLCSAYLVANNLYFSTKQFPKNFSNLLFTGTRRFKNRLSYNGFTLQ